MGGYDEEIAVARSLALAAGHLIMYHYRNRAHANQHIKSMGKGDAEIFQEPVTLADSDADAFIRKELARLFPADGILSEEHAQDIQHLTAQMTRQRYWCVDPLDGTQEFLEGNTGEFCVMIALVEGDTPVLGVMRVPGKGEEYYGVLGHGAYVAREGMETRLAVSRVERLPEARLLASRSHPPRNILAIARAAEIPQENIVRVGSVGVKIGMLCEAKADCYLHPKEGIKLWDTAAPQVILHESGGLLTDTLGRSIRYRPRLREIKNLFITGGIVATNGRLHDAVIGLMKQMPATGENSANPLFRPQLGTE